MWKSTGVRALLQRFPAVAGLLLHLLGAGAIPAYHAVNARPISPIPVVAEDEAGAAATHDERTCAVCHTSRPVQSPGRGGGWASLPVAPSHSFPRSSRGPAAESASPTRVRAPPALS